MSFAGRHYAPRQQRIDSTVAHSRQVTDSYLLALARPSRQLATFDRAWSLMP